MSEVKELSQAILSLVDTVAGEVVADLQARFAKMFASYRLDVNDQIRGIIDLLNGEDVSSEDVLPLVVDLRASLMDLQEGVDENAGVWSPEVKKQVIDGVVEKLRQGSTFAFDRVIAHSSSDLSETRDLSGN